MNFKRRSVLKKGLLMGGGAALSTALPSLMLPHPAPAAALEAKPDSPPTPPASHAVVPPADSSADQARFSKEFLSNKVFGDLPLNFDPPGRLVQADGSILQVGGASVQSTGNILFQILAPLAKEVSLRFDQVRSGGLPLTKRDNGVFEGLLAYEDNHTGPMTVDVYIDGTVFIYPYMPIRWSGGHPHNFVEVPDTEMEFMHIKNVPHGAMSREIFWADPIKSWERCLVYTPPGYMNSTQHYPVLYLQHGGGENETVWEYCGRVAHILDNLIAGGKVEPFIVVMNNDMLRYGDNNTAVASNIAGVVDDAFERILIESCIPHMEGNYRLKTGKWNRALAGLSMGSMMSCDIAFRHPETFGNLATFTASMTHETFATTYERPYKKVLQDPKAFAKNYKVYFRSTTQREDHFDYFVADDKLCADAGIDKLPNYHRIVYPTRTTKWNSWRLGLRDYAQLLFRQTAA